MTFWDWVIIVVLVGSVHYRVMQNKKSISNLFCILEDNHIKISRVFMPLSLSEAWSGDMVDPDPLQPGQDILEAFRQQRTAKETGRRKWWKRAFIGAIIAAILLYIWYQLQ